MGDNAEAGGPAMDSVLMALGWRGRYQMLQIFQHFLSIFPLAFNILSIVFIGKINEHKCKEVDNDTSHVLPDDALNVTYGRCSVTYVNITGRMVEITCPNGMDFQEPIDRSLMSEWDLVCERESLTAVSQSLLLAGMMVGAVLFTSLADRFGRKPFHVGCHVGLLAVGVGQAFAPSFSAFLPLRFFLGAFQQGTGLTSGILSMELVPAKYRSSTGVLGAFLWASGMVLLALISFLMTSFSWRHLQLVIAAFSVYCLLQIWFTDESLRWLVANGKIEQAEKILKKASAMNKVNEADVLAVFRSRVLHQKPDNVLLPTTSDNVASSLSPPAGRKTGNDGGEANEFPKYGVLDFFRHKYVFLCVAINGFAWTVNAMTYYGLSMTSVTLAENMYLGFFLSALMEIPTCLVFISLVDRIGRKRLCDVFHVMAGVSLLLSVALPLVWEGAAIRVVVVALSLLGKLAISITFSVIFLFTPEQFPTNLRNASLGVASTFGRVGAMVAPYSGTLIRHVSWGPGVIFGTCCLLLPLFMRLVPETSGRELPSTIEEMTLYVTTPYQMPKSRWRKRTTRRL